MQQRILAVHDLSGFGHTSLLAIIPIFYRMGHELAVLPSALLSANTDYLDYQQLDTADFMQQSLQHWLIQKQEFSAIYTGFLGSPRQVDILCEYLPKLHKASAPILIDPVLGDNGKLYGCYDARMVTAMRKLLSLSTLITPNFSEAAFLLQQDPFTHNPDMKQWCRDLAKLGPQKVIITSAPGSDGKNNQVVFYDSTADYYQQFDCQYETVCYPGAGDCFAAMLLAAIMKGIDVPVAIKGSIAFVRDAFILSRNLVSDVRSGIALARALHTDPSGYFSG